MAILIEYWPYLVKTAKYLAIFGTGYFTSNYICIFLSFLVHKYFLELKQGNKKEIDEKKKNVEDINTNLWKVLTYFGECLLSNYYKLIDTYVHLYCYFNKEKYLVCTYTTPSPIMSPYVTINKVLIFFLFDWNVNVFQFRWWL